MSRQRNIAQMKEQNKTPEKRLCETQRANLLDAEFKTLVVRMLRELIKYGNNIKEEMKVTLSEIKKNLQGTNKEVKAAWIQTNDLEHKEKIKHSTRTERRNKNSKTRG